MLPQSNYVRLNGYEVHYTEWGSANAPPLILWHGLSRTGRDFDDIAHALSDTYRVICPDTIGRGLSQWSARPDTEYCFAEYAKLASAMLDTLLLGRVRWVGTSMGGALGIAAGATTLKGRISHFVSNDMGPNLPPGPFERIKTYIGNSPDFATMAELEAYYRKIYVPFGAHTDAQWRRMAETGMRRLANGRITTHYDPALVRQLFNFPDDFEQWEAYDALDTKMLVLRGVTSDLLLADVAQAMATRGPRARIVEIPDCGHAPGLNVPEQIGIVREFLAT